jgi:hypothetical protein
MYPAFKFAIRRLLANAACLATVFYLLAMAPARAGVILYDNLSAPVFGADSVTGLGPLGDSFSTGSSAVNLTDVKVMLEGRSSDGSIAIDLFSDTSAQPGVCLASLGVLGDSALSATPTVFDFPVTPSIALDANTRYWVEISSANGSTAAWDWSGDISGPGVATEFFSVAGISLPNDDGPHLMQITAEAAVANQVIPEPNGLILFGLAAICLAAFSWARNWSYNSRCLSAATKVLNVER